MDSNAADMKSGDDVAMVDAGAANAGLTAETAGLGRSDKEHTAAAHREHEAATATGSHVEELKHEEANKADEEVGKPQELPKVEGGGDILTGSTYVPAETAMEVDTAAIEEPLAAEMMEMTGPETAAIVIPEASGVEMEIDPAPAATEQRTFDLPAVSPAVAQEETIEMAPVITPQAVGTAPVTETASAATEQQPTEAAPAPLSDFEQPPARVPAFSMFNMRNVTYAIPTVPPQSVIESLAVPSEPVEDLSPTTTVPVPSRPHPTEAEAQATLTEAQHAVAEVQLPTDLTRETHISPPTEGQAQAVLTAAQHAVAEVPFPTSLAPETHISPTEVEAQATLAEAQHAVADVQIPIGLTPETHIPPTEAEAQATLAEAQHAVAEAQLPAGLAPETHIPPTEAQAEATLTEAQHAVAEAQLPIGLAPETHIPPTEAQAEATLAEAQHAVAEVQVPNDLAPETHIPPQQPPIPQYQPATLQFPQPGAPLNYTGPTADSASDSSGDSALGSVASTRSTSLTSSIYAYRVENGRRYHAQREGVDYALPNDEQELDRLDLQHHLFTITLGGALHHAPIATGVQDVLDIGTGTGIWAIDFADRYPSATVTGTDVSPIQPTYVPPNCHFYVDDAEAEWNFPSSFDYIHARMLVVAIRNWPRFMQQAFAALKPGSWIEFQDLTFPPRCDDGTADITHPVMSWSEHMRLAAMNMGVDMMASNHFPAWLEAAGFVDVTVETYAWPLGRWPKDKTEKEKGMWVTQNFLEGLNGFTMAFFSRGLGWRREEIEVICAKVREAVGRRGAHIYLPIAVIYARKPDVVGA